MKICIICPDFYPPLYGNSRIAWEYSIRLSKTNEVCAITNGKKYSIKNINGVKIISIPFQKKKWNLEKYNYIRKSILKFSPDIVHGFGLFSSILTLFCKICGNFKTVQTISGITPLYYIGTKKIKIPKIFKIIPLIGIDGIIFCNKYSKKYFIENFYGKILTKKIAIIPYLIENIWFSKKEEKIKEDKKTVVFFGDGTIERGLFILLSSIPYVINKSPDIRFIIAIRHWRDYLKERALLTINNYSKNVTLLEYPLDIHISQIVKKGDIVALPFNVNSMEPPVSLVESMALGKPVITSNIGGNIELIGENSQGILISPGDDKQLAQSILHLLSDKKLRKDIGINSKKYINSYYEPQKIINQMHFFYNKII